MAESLTIAVLGAGNIGGTLGRAWLAANHRVAFGVRDTQSQNARNLRQDFGERASVGTVAEALAANPDVVLLAVPGGAIEAILVEHAARLDGRIVLDAANGGPADGFARLQEQLPRAHIYRAFNTLGWENFADPIFAGVPADLFYCGTDGESRPRVEQLIADVGMRPIYLGGSERVGVVDALATLWSTLAYGQHQGRQIAFKVLSR